MDPEQWRALSPEQQAWHWQQHYATAGPPPVLAAPVPASPPVNAAAIVSLTAGGLALLVLPILLGPVAVIAGVVGTTVGNRTGRGGRMSAGGIVLGLIVTLLVLSRFGAV